jgi:uncharacterized protein (TIGR02231 family)
MRHPLFPLLVSAAFSPAALTAPVWAADLPVASRIEAVTVFPDAAAVTRLAEARLPAGEHAIILRGLPAGIDPASIRVEAQADGPLAIGSADVRRAPAETEAGDTSQRKLRELRAELAGTRGRIEAIEAQKRAVGDLTRIAAEAAAKGPAGFDVDRARAAWTAVGEATAAANAALQGETTRAAELDAEIRAIEAAIGRPRPGQQPLTDLAVAVEAGRDLTAKLTITYRVAGARWTPLYDAALDTSGAGPARLSLVRRASVTQRTGEDWSDVALTLSTTRVAGGSAAPEVMTQALGLRDPAVVFMEQRPRTLAAPAPAARMEAAPGADLGAPREPEFARAAEREAVANAGAFSASFAAPGRVSITRDGASRTLRLSTHALDVPLTARVAPALDARAYLSATVAWADDVALLPGEVALTRDGVFVGRGRIGLVAGGDSFELGFGVDERIKVERAPVRRRDNDPSGSGASRIQISDHRTTITNLHRRPMRITVIDRIPVSENSAVTVEPLPSNTAPTERIVQDRRGVMAWTHDHQPGERREIRLGWRMRWPADRELVTQ